MKQNAFLSYKVKGKMPCAYCKDTWGLEVLLHAFLILAHMCFNCSKWCDAWKGVLLCTIMYCI